jgi:hypothetical protein
MQSPGATRRETVTLLLTVLWFGALWGAVEAVLGGILHGILPGTYPGQIMMVIAAGLMTYAIRRTGTAWMPLGMAVVAAPLKLFSAAILVLPVTAPQVINPAASILAEGLTFAVAAHLLYRRSSAEPLRFGLIGLGAGALQAVLAVAFVLGPGVRLYPSMAVLQALGAKYPTWVTSPSATMSYLVTSTVTATLLCALGALVVGLMPLGERRAYRPAWLAVGSAVCLAIFFVASWHF